MIELATVMLTLGAILFHSLHLSLGTILYCAILLSISISIFFRTWTGMFYGFILGAVLVLGALAIWRVDSPVPKDLYGNRAIVAKVMSVDRRLDRTLIVVLDPDFDKKLQISLPERSTYLPGDIVSVRGNVIVPEDFVTSSGRIFGYQAYLESKGIVAIINNATVLPVEKGNLSLARVATQIRYGVSDILSKYIYNCSCSSTSYCTST